MYFDDKKNIITEIDEYKIYEGNEKYRIPTHFPDFFIERKEVKKAISLVKLNSNLFLLGGGGEIEYLLNAFNIKNLKAEETIIKHSKPKKKNNLKKEEENKSCFLF